MQALRDGKNFSTRNIVGSQNGKAIFTMSASFQRPPPTHEFDHQMTPVEAITSLPQPEDLKTFAEINHDKMEKLPAHVKDKFMQERGIDMRPIESRDMAQSNAGMAQQHVWLRANGPLPKAPALHQYLLTYASDFNLLTTALIPHNVSVFTHPRLHMASLDHAVWFHRAFAFDEWLVYVMDSPSACGDRTLVRGEVYTRDGVLVASTVQEGMMRMRPA